MTTAVANKTSTMENFFKEAFNVNWKEMKIQEFEMGFKLIRDTFIFTTKRLILIDKQGLTGSKTEYKSISYKSVSRFSVETAGTFDLDAELKIWISSEEHPSIKKQFNKSVDVYEVQKVLAHHVLK